ncbi:MAG: methylenetetrahydrofolate reductase C-terminal domain-containing protein [Bacteroidales bacterium]|nr:methylenetetrahydrofolate reductase C-terminal domain-containing protein [Bacteroidales bacterium]
MSLFTPGRRWQPPFYPFRKETAGRRLLAFTERKIKGPLFGCRMCGNCLLQETALICSMECPKGMRNGPCGGSSVKNCYVDETRPCIWYKIYEKSFRLKREEKLLEVLPPLDWEKVGTETWGEVFLKIRQFGFGKFISSVYFSKDIEKKKNAWDAVFRTIRQPEWWKGDSEYHAPKYDEPASELERKLKEGKFVVTSEVTPPISISTNKLTKEIQLLKPFVSAVNFTDSSSATPSMSSVACCKIAIDCGAEPVLQIAARDATRSSFQSLAIGANALGVKNILCLTGDSAKQGATPKGSMNIVDLDSVQMLWILRRMRDEGIYLHGKQIKFPPKFFLGAAASPFASEPKFQAIREQKKIDAGAQFFQTNLIYDPDGLETWINELTKRGIRNKVYILAGITPLRSFKMAMYLHNNVPGVTIPEKYLKRMENAGDKAEEEGVKIAVELIKEIKSRNIVNGIHMMAIGWEVMVPRILTEAGLSMNN